MASAVTETKQKESKNVLSNAGKIVANKKKHGKKKKESLPPTTTKKTVDYLIPLPLILVVFLCSGFCWTLSFRDLMATGRPIFGGMDEALMQFTKSTQFYDDTKGWKSKGGGLSAIDSVSTDANNMGGLFVRKLNGAAGIMFYSQKIMPMMLQSEGTVWGYGHYRPLLGLSIVGNIAAVSFYATYLEDLATADAHKIYTIVIGLLVVETIAMLGYFMLSKRQIPLSFNAFPKNKNPTSIPSRIVMRTVMIVSSLMTIISTRDLFLPGQIISFIPRDDIYLEWTNAFMHSPPPYSPEAEEHGMGSLFNIGDKFLSQSCALFILINCLFKFYSSSCIKMGKAGDGEIKCKIIWKWQAVGGALLVLILRLFATASKSASLDLRWHLMCAAYEVFILGIHAFI